MNRVENTTTEDGLIVWVQITNGQNLHAALALPNSPIPQGANVADSEAAFRAWIIAGAANVNPASQFPANSPTSLMFHHLSVGDSFDICTGQWLNHAWYFEMLENRRGPEAARIGEFAMVFVISGTEQNGTAASLVPGIFV